MGIAENMSLFDVTENPQPRKLEVVEASFVSAHATTWRELFTGYDRLYAITYSAGINFIHQVLQLFDHAEIIFGCEATINYSIAEVIAFHAEDMKVLRKDAKIQKYLHGRIDDGNLHLFIANEKLSHEKIYLMEADDGRKRVVMGSANMSSPAFTGTQRENICFFDGVAAFDWYMGCFSHLKSGSSVEIPTDAIGMADLGENLDNLLFSRHVRAKKVVLVTADHQKEGGVDKAKYTLDLHNAAKDIKPLLPPQKNKYEGSILLSSDDIIKIRRRAIEQRNKEKNSKGTYPRLTFDLENQTASLNDTPLDLAPGNDEIAKDIEMYFDYMEGFGKFYGDTAQMQKRYFDFAVWYLASPFMAVLRHTAVRNEKSLHGYPIFGLLYGQSKSGKTSFLETLLKMMIGQKPKISAPDFTKTNIGVLRGKARGIPIIVDDLTATRFNSHAAEIIKFDDFGIADNDIHYPIVAISANEDVKVVSQELVRRTVICHVQGGLKNLEAMRSNTVNRIQKNIGTAFYREYLRRMLEQIPYALEWLTLEDAPPVRRRNPYTG